MNNEINKDNRLIFMSIVRIMKQHGVEDAIRMYPDFEEFIRSNRNADLKELKKEILNDWQHHATVAH